MDMSIFERDDSLDIWNVYQNQDSQSL